MLRSVFIPNKNNAFAWANVLFLVLLVVIGEIDARTILFAYFLETIIIGVFNCFKMYASYKHNDTTAKIWQLIPFFIFHYSFFIAVQSVFLFAIFSFGKHSLVKEPFSIIENYNTVIHLDGMLIVIGLFTITQFLKYLFDFSMMKKYNEYKVNEVMFKPYARIFIQQFTVILAGFFIAFSNASIVAAILLIIIRALVDFFLVAIRENSILLDYIVEKSYDGKTSKEDLRKQLLLMTE